MHISDIDRPDEVEIRPRFMRKLAMYLFCTPFVKGRKVIHLGCEEGYFTARLADEAHEILGIDNRPEAVAEAKRKHISTNLSFELMDINHLQFDDNLFDVSLSIGVIEHIKDYRRHIKEAHRILKTGGLFILGALNGSLSLGTDPYHFQEFGADEMRELLHEHFSTVDLYGVKGKSAAVIEYWKRRRARLKNLLRWDFLRLHKWLPRPIYAVIFNFLKKRHRQILYSVLEEEISKITPDDFVIEKEDLEEAWTFICLARK